MISQIKLRFKDKLYPATCLDAKGRWYLNFGYNPGVMAEVKAFAGVQYHGYDGAPDRDFVKQAFGKDKIWSIEQTPRNQFQYDYLTGGNPYKAYDAYLKSTTRSFKCKRPEAYEHQHDLVNHGLSVHYGIFAAEMGTGKSLAAIEVIEQSGSADWWWVGPKSALKSVEREFRRWNSSVTPQFMTYEGLTKRMKGWKDGTKTPVGIILDEGSRCKTPTSLRSQAAQAIADGIRKDHGLNGYVILMSGSPAPKSPADWWSLCEVVCPGFIREGTLVKFSMRLGVFLKKETDAGVHHEKVTWLDNELKCNVCGMFQDDPVHAKMGNCVDEASHTFVPSTNEVYKLYSRMSGLVIVKRKKDCLSLPEKIYHIVECKPEPSTLRAAKMIVDSTPRAAQALILLRELSDGFQYRDEVVGKKPCEVCYGLKEVSQLIIKPEFQDLIGLDASLSQDEYEQKYFDRVMSPCDGCAGSGTQDKLVRTLSRVKCPKDDALIEMLDLHSDVGRLVVYGGFQGSIDRITALCQNQKWAVIQWDGRGTKILDTEGKVFKADPLDLFQDDFEKHPRVAFVGQPGAAGMGLTLTASPSIVYYSNTFGGEDRIQSEDRIHRPGCTGANIWDFIHLPSDLKVLNNLKAKRELQDMTMGELISAVSEERLFRCWNQ